MAPLAAKGLATAPRRRTARPALPVPVVARRTCPVLLPALGQLLDEGDGVADGAELLRLLVADLDAERLLEGHDELHGVERVGPEVLDERRRGRDLVLLDPELLDDDLLDPAFDLGPAHARRLLGGAATMARTRGPGVAVRLVGGGSPPRA